MKQYLLPIIIGSLSFMPDLAIAADVNCTATPDCTTLGYTKSADSCPDGGIKCPFDSSRMFCLRSADLGFRFKNDVKAGDYVYKDGTTSNTYTKGKGMLGIALRVHPGNPRHALVLKLPTHVISAQCYTVRQHNAMSACGDGWEAGVYGTGTYLAGIGELSEISPNGGGMLSTIQARLYAMTQSNALYFCYTGGTSRSYNYVSSTQRNSTSYYYLTSLGGGGSAYGAVGSDTTDRDGNYLCVMYL